MDTHTEDITEQEAVEKRINLIAETPSSCFISLGECSCLEKLLNDKDNQTETGRTKA
jgi:hypothetical protein